MGEAADQPIEEMPFRSIKGKALVFVSMKFLRRRKSCRRSILGKSILRKSLARLF
jgi:hypothetical protein